MVFKKKNQTALTIMSVLLIIAILLFSIRIYCLQVLDTEDLADNSDGAATLITSVLKAPRGEIIDCYGRQIAINRDGYNIVFNKAYVKDDLNDVILALINLCGDYDTDWVDELPLESKAPYNFTDGNTERLIKTLGLATYATAENCFNELVRKYSLEGYSVEEQRKIMGVRYSMTIADFSISYPYTFSEDIPTELMRMVSESGFALSGVTVDVVPFREYVDTSLAVNIIGNVGPIYAEEWEESLRDAGYSYNDKVGKSGIELWAEEYLRGQDGEITYRLDAEGNIISKEVTKEPVAGKTVRLTLDKSIQRTAQDTLETTVKNLRAEGGTAVAGAVVVTKVDTGAIICAANYPTYDSATLGEDYNELVNDKRNPLLNRAFSGVYPVGSTIKPIVAIAAMESGLYNKGEAIRCVGEYRYFSDYKPDCMHVHGSILLKTALAKSCNYFFFELGRRIGATALTDYYKQFGLGVATGVEVGDSSGILYVPDSDGSGDTLQIAIGQLNAFTPLQLANYTATLANGGTRYQVSLIDSIVSYDMTEVYKTNEPKVLNKIEISDNVLKAVKEGMLSVTEDGTGSATLGDYSIKVGGKTGTSQVDGAADHSIFIAFAPFDNPEIAISVVLENGSSTSSVGKIVRTVLDSYFYAEGGATDEELPFEVLQ